MRRWIVLLLCVLVVGAIYERDALLPSAPPAVAAWLGSGSESNGAGGETGGKSGGRSGGAGRATAVTVATAEAGSLPIQRDVVGWIRPLASTTLSTETTGIVTTIAAHDGQRVKTGTLLVALDDRAARALVAKDEAAIARDQATLDAANTSLTRIQRLVASGANTQQAGDDALTAVKSAEATLQVDRATLDTDKVSLAKTEVLAPFDGRLGAFQLSTGALVTPGTAIVTLTQTTPVYAEFSLSESDLDLVHAAYAKKDLTVSVVPAGGATPGASGPVVFIDNAVDQASGTVRLRALLPNSGTALVPNQSISVAATAGTRDDLVLVPSVAVEPSEGGSVVYVAKPDDTIEIRRVEVALRVGERTGLSAGLEAGERVVTEGQGTLTEGAHVSVKDSAAPPAAKDPAGAAPEPGGETASAQVGPT